MIQGFLSFGLIDFWSNDLIYCTCILGQTCKNNLFPVLRF